MSVKIITDSISDISSDVAEAFEIEVIPIEISLESQYVSVADLDITESVKWIEHNKRRPDFKGISTENFVKVFEKHISNGMEIICITAGSKSISNYDCACHASTRFPNVNIHVIDSHQLSAAVGIMCVKAAIMAKEGNSANAIAIKLERTMSKFKMFGLADSLDFLQYSGFCPKLVAAGSNLLNVKFEFAMHEDRNFDVHIVGNSMDKAVKSYGTNLFKDLDAIDPKIIFLVHTISDEEYFAKVYKSVVDLNYFEEIVVSNTGHFNTSVVGRNGMSVAYQLK